MRRQLVDLLFVIIEVPFVLAAPFLAARWVGERERAQWDPHYGDPDGESIVFVLQVIIGVAVVLASCLVVLIVEVSRRRLRRRRDRRRSLEPAT